ncbi:sulfotransferase family 2 domain-containing protein [Isoptericola sp. AK164]|uniref:sulfotransferase family 2 domain-containing protein n=1 Tax=Isoptericola sp. AK164 TaxID=3024246 RepID=UPI0024184AFB|nr:sulfotransferase family 2 domain-containing protein [Isoptericola sp. AK164]
MSEQRRRIETRDDAPRDAGDAGDVWNSWVLPDHRVVFVNVAKNASTSLKWLMAELTGKDPQRFHQVMNLAPTRQQTIHRKSAWSGVDSLVSVDPELRAQISPENGWFVFAVVRDPRLRVWSAWQSKFLIGNPRHSFDKFRDAPWLPRVPGSTQDVVEDFAAFVRLLDSPQGSRVFGDVHFRPQVSLLNEDTVPYSHLYQTSEIPKLLTDLGAHVGEQGHRGEIGPLARENETPLPVAGRLFPTEVRETLDRLYADDLARFGHLWDFDTVLAKDPEWSADAFKDIAARVATGQRLADIALAGRQVRRERAATDEEIRQLRGRVAELEAALERRTVRGASRAAADRLRSVWGRR